MARPDAESKSLLETATAKYETNVEMVYPYLLGRGIEADVARSFRLGSVSEPEPGHESARGRLSIPYLTPTGIVAMKFRCIAEHNCDEHGHPKYTGPKGQKVKLYNVAALHAESNHIGIAEGELDALVLTAYCGIPATGVPGAGNWKANRHWPRLYSGFSRVLVFRDPDPAGDELASRICESLTHARVVELPGDVNETFLDKGPEAIRAMAGLS